MKNELAKQKQKKEKNIGDHKIYTYKEKYVKKKVSMWEH